MADKPSEKNGKFDTGLIRELAAILREADLGEIEIEQSGVRIKVAKAKQAVTVSARCSRAGGRRGRRRSGCCCSHDQGLAARSSRRG